MAPLPKFFRDLLDRTDLPLQASTAWPAFEDKPARDLRTVVDQALELLGDGTGPMLVEQGLTRDCIPAPLTAAMLKEDAGFAALLAGPEGVTLTQKSTIRLLQRALQAVGARVPGSPPALRITGWGADGDFGQETTAALAAFQKAQGLVVDGKLGPRVAAALLEAVGSAPVPDLWKATHPALRLPRGVRRMVDIAREMVLSTADEPFEPTVGDRTYRYYAALFGTDAPEAGRLEAPGGISYGLQPGTSYWKCNIFAGTCIALSGLPVAAFRWSNTSTSLHFPRAEKFGERLAALPGWTLLRHLDHRDPEDETRPLAGTTQNAEIAELLHLVRPGDLLFVDHPGAPGNDGGHCRLAVEPADPADPDSAPAFAQASFNQATVQRDGLGELGGGTELQFWLVRYTG